METTRYLSILLVKFGHLFADGRALFFACYFFIPGLLLVATCKNLFTKKYGSGKTCALLLLAFVCTLPLLIYLFFSSMFPTDPKQRLAFVCIYVVGGVVGWFFKVRLVRCWLLLPVAFLVANSIYAFCNSYPLTLYAFGSVAEEPLSEKIDGFDYEIRMEFSDRKLLDDSRIYDNRVARLRVKGDSAYACTFKETCGVRDSLENCEWITLAPKPVDSLEKMKNQFYVRTESAYIFCVKDCEDYLPVKRSRDGYVIDFVRTPKIFFDMSPEKRTVSQVHLLKNLVELYTQEKIPYEFSGGAYRFDISLLDYRRGVRRRIEIGNAMAAEPGDLPNAKRIDEIARAFLPITKDTPMDWRGKKCKN